MESFNLSVTTPSSYMRTSANEKLKFYDDIETLMRSQPMLTTGNSLT